MDERVSVAGAGVFPVALVEDVVGEDADTEVAVFAAGGVARAEVEEVVAAYADEIVAGCVFAGGVAPTGKEVKVGEVGGKTPGRGDVGEGG